MQILTDLIDILAGGATGTTASLPASVVPQSITGTFQGVSVDLGNYEVATAALVNIAAITGTVTTVTIQIDEWNGTTALSSTWALVPGTSLAVTTNGTYVVTGLRTYEFARINIQGYVATTTTSAIVSGNLLGMPKSSQKASGYSRSPSV